MTKSRKKIKVAQNAGLPDRTQINWPNSIEHRHKQFHSIQLLRFAAALAVVIFHSIIHLAIVSQFQVPQLIYHIAGIGRAGVHIFFVISGFVMFHTAQNRFGTANSVLLFLKRRIIRIYPIFWISIAIYLGVALALGESIRLENGVFWRMLLLVPGDASAVIDPAWTLSYEIYFYGIFAASLIFRASWALACLTIFFASSVVVGLMVPNDFDGPILSLVTNVLLLEFLAGVWLAHFAIRHERFIANIPGKLVTLCFWAALFALLPGPFFASLGVPWIVTLGLPSAAIVACAMIGEMKGQTRAMVIRGAWLGESSYSLYLIHMVIILTLVPVFTPQITSILAMLFFAAIMTAISFIIGIALHLWIEKPVLKFAHQVLS